MGEIIKYYAMSEDCENWVCEDPTEIVMDHFEALDVKPGDVLKCYIYEGTRELLTVSNFIPCDLGDIVLEQIHEQAYD